jgi:hypothetical protein
MTGDAAAFLTGLFGHGVGDFVADGAGDRYDVCQGCRTGPDGDVKTCGLAENIEFKTDKSPAG